MNAGTLTRGERVKVVVGTAIICALGAIPIWQRRRQREERGGRSFETMAEKLEAQKAMEEKSKPAQA